jgi:REP element-mobilizing transposase RayT
MARPLRIEYPGAVYHITSRGNAREAIFLSDANRQTFLDTLAATIKKYNWLCHAFCLLDNHYHAIIETPDPNLSLGMRQLNGVYTQAFNRCHQRVGHVFQGRYKVILVEKDSHLLELCRYVVLNPVRAGMVTKPDEWKWSSYKSTAYVGKVPEYLTIDWVLGQFVDKNYELNFHILQFYILAPELQNSHKSSLQPYYAEDILP